MKSNAKIDLENKQGKTGLMWTTEEGHIGIAALLTFVCCGRRSTTTGRKPASARTRAPLRAMDKSQKYGKGPELPREALVSPTSNLAGCCNAAVMDARLMPLVEAWPGPTSIGLPALLV